MAWQSSGDTNDEMVDQLQAFGVITQSRVADAFRVIDRKYFVPDRLKGDAYSDQPLKHGNVHLSAPHIYGTAMDALDLQDGQSFLNIGSGTGYISSIAAYLTGPTAINHNIELHEDVCAHAHKSIADLKAHLIRKQLEREREAANEAQQSAQTMSTSAVLVGPAIPAATIEALGPEESKGKERSDDDESEGERDVEGGAGAATKYQSEASARGMSCSSVVDDSEASSSFSSSFSSSSSPSSMEGVTVPTSLPPGKAAEDTSEAHASPKTPAKGCMMGSGGGGTSSYSPASVAVFELGEEPPPMTLTGTASVSTSAVGASTHTSMETDGASTYSSDRTADEEQNVAGVEADLGTALDHEGITRPSFGRAREPAMAHIEICHGSIFNVDKEDCMRYDRIYIGAACPPDMRDFMCELLAVGGVLVGPLGDELLKIRRVSDHPSTGLVVTCLAGVRFAPLIRSEPSSDAAAEGGPSLSLTGSVRLPRRVWCPMVHSSYPRSFTTSVRTLLLVAARPGTLPASLPSGILEEVIRYTDRLWFVPEPSEADKLRRRLDAEVAARQEAESMVREAKRARREAERERDIYKTLARRLHMQLQYAHPNGQPDGASGGFLGMDLGDRKSVV